MAIKLTYCQLIRIILSQLGGNPLQLVYTQLTQGMPSVSMRSGLFSEIAQMKALVDEVTARIQAVTKDVNDYEKMARELAGQFMANPMAASIQAALTAVNTRLASATDPAEIESLTTMSTNLAQFLDITNKLSGVTPSGSGGSCSLADLLGNGCTPAANVPDVDLGILIASLKDHKGLVDLIKTRVQSGVGLDQFAASITQLNNTINSISQAFQNIFSKQFIKNAVSAYLNQIIFSLLSGCKSDVLSLTIKGFTGSSFGSVDGSYAITGTGSAASNVVTVSDTSNIIVGQTVTGTNVAPNTTVIAVYDSNSKVVFSNVPTGNILSGNVTFTTIGTGANLDIGAAITEAVLQLQNVYSSGEGFVNTSGNVFLLPNSIDVINLT